MKILFIITQSEIGGAQRFLLEFAPYLAQREHQISVVAGEGDGELLKQLGIKYQVLSIRYSAYKIKNLIRGLNPIKDFLALISILQIINKEKPDTLFLQSTKAGFLGSLAAKLIGLYPRPYPLNPRVIYRIGGWSFQDPRPWWANKIIFWMEKISAPLKNTIIVNSELDRQLAINRKIAPPEKVVKIYNGIDPDVLNFLSRQEARRFLESRIKNLEFSNTNIVIGTIANLYATKGIEYLVEAALILTLNPKPYPLTPIFVVLGEGKERDRLEGLIRKYDLKNFSLVGRMPNASQYLKAFDAFVLSSVKEGFPWVLLEAMAAEVPTIATKVGAVPEIIEDGKNGLLVPPKDGEALAEKITRIIESPTLSQEIIENASEKLKSFSLEKMLVSSEDIINDQ